MDRMIITQAMIEAGMSDNGALSFKQIDLLGFGKYSGWRRRAVGKEILTERYKEFLALKNVHLKKRKHKTSVLLARCIKYILLNSADGDSEFDCGTCEIDCNKDCDNRVEFNAIMEEFNK